MNEAEDWKELLGRGSQEATYESWKYGETNGRERNGKSKVRQGITGAIGLQREGN